MSGHPLPPSEPRGDAGTSHDLTSGARHEEWLALALEGAHLGMWEWEIASGAFTRSAGHDEMFGHAVPQPTWDVTVAARHVLAADRPILRRAFDEVPSRGVIEFEVRVHAPDGALRWIRSTGRARHDQEGRLVRVVGVVSDITAQRQAEANVASREERYRTLFNSIDEGFCIIEFFDGPHGPLSDYIHVEANPAYALHAGIPNVVGQKVREMVPAEADGWVALYGEVLRTGVSIRFERELVATGRHLELAAFRVGPAERRQVAVLFQDITGRKRADRAIQELNETLEARVKDAVAERLQEQERLREAEEALRHSQKMEAVGQLTGGIAHDFNNLLTGISGSLELLQTRLQQGRLNDCFRYLTAAQGASRRAASLTHRLLAFSRRQTLDPKPTDVNRLVMNMEELISRTVGPHIAVEVVTAPRLWSTLIDASQLENALLNLCINARDAMPTGGRITIETSNKWLDETAAKQRDIPPGQYLSLCVTDTGTGIAPEIIDRVFDPFFTTKPIGEGTGLGLSMVYGFVRQSGGQIRVYSEVGQGTTMCIYLPRHYREGQEPEDEPLGTSSRSVFTGETVLIVDDEPTIRMLVFESLTEDGFHVIEAADGHEGLKILQSDVRIDVLVTDVGLPGGMNGRQLADAARLLKPDLQILFITGYAENAVIGNGELPPGMRVLTKPFPLEVLTQRIQEMLGR
ncbi:MAG TPA: response regulator [Candidatus Aquabacterium excrementipullorum]|nr:response regulator [Candidatus Aquabacterium excrementipullorum]